MTTQILVFLDWKKEFHVHVDASSIALAIVLAHLGEVEIDHPIAFASRKLCLEKRNNTMTEREGLAMVYYMQKYKDYFLGAHFKLYVDHSS